MLSHLFLGSRKVIDPRGFQDLDIIAILKSVSQTLGPQTKAVRDSLKAIAAIYNVRDQDFSGSTKG